MISDSIDFRPSYNFESDRRKLLNFFFLIDTSRSMCMDGKIDIVNEWLEKVVSALRETVLGNLSKFELRIAVMTFAENARWIVPPTSVLEYRYKEIECGKYDVNFGSAFRSLGEKLTRKEYMAHTGKIVRPYIILMTGSRPTEQDNYEPELDIPMT